MNHPQMRNSLLSFSPFHQKKINNNQPLQDYAGKRHHHWLTHQPGLNSHPTRISSWPSCFHSFPNMWRVQKRKKKNINSLFITALPALMVTEVRPSLLCRVKAGLRHQLASCMSWTVGGNRSTSERSHTDAVRTCKLHKEMPWIRTKLATYLLWAAAVKPIMPKSYL